MLKHLNNKYFLLRHGESKANVAEIIVSDPEHGVDEDFTLTQKGEEQVLNSVKKAKEENLLDGNILIYSSPFSRCKKTAEIVKEFLGIKGEIIFDDRLQERWFGDFDKTSIKNYKKVWDNDQKNNESIKNEETVENVEKRTTALIMDLEQKYNSETFLLVSHGDVLQILETSFSDTPTHMHRNVEPLDNAEIRELRI